MQFGGLGTEEGLIPSIPAAPPSYSRNHHRPQTFPDKQEDEDEDVDVDDNDNDDDYDVDLILTVELGRGDLRSNGNHWKTTHS